jgi:hypothetical protein
MLSLFRRTLCYVMVLQMVLMPVYGASALPVVMVSDTKAQTLLTSQVIALANLNIKLLELNNAQKTTNETLTKILGAIKYQAPAEAKDIPTTDTILAEFSSSLYAAYTSDSIAYNAIREGPAAAAKVNAAAAPATTPATSGTPAPAATPATSTPAGTPAPTQGTATPPNPFDPSAPALVDVPAPAGDFSGAFDPSASTNATLGYTLKDSLIAKPSDPLGNIAKFTRQVRDLSENLGDTYYALQGLQGNCQGGGLNCAQSGLNFLTNLPDVLGKFGIALSPDITKNIGQIGQIGGAIFTLVGTFGGGQGFDAGQLTTYIRSVQGFLIGSGLLKGGFALSDEVTGPAGSLKSMFYDFAGLFGLPVLEAMGTRTDFPNVLAQLGDVAGATEDSFRTGPLSKDTPLAGTTNLPPNQTLNTADIAKFLLSMLRCNPKMANNSTTKCKQIEEANKRLFLGQLKSRCAAAAISKQQIPAKMFQELFTGTGNPKRCEKVQFYDTKSGKELCPSIALLQASSLAEGSVMSQMNVLIGLSMYNLVMTNVNTEQVILQNACASLGDLIESGAPVYQATD